MRLAYICADPGVPVFGRKGASVHVQEVIRALKRQGVEIVLVAARLGGEAPNDLSGLAIIGLPEIAAKDGAERERRLLGLNEIIERLLNESGHFDAVYERHSLWSFAAIEWARREAVPGLLEVNAPLLVEQAGYRVLHDAAAARDAVARAYGAAGAVLAVSQGVADYVACFAPGLAEKVYVVPNGVDPARFQAHRHDGQTPLTVGFVGTLKPWHGVDTLIEAFAHVHRGDSSSRLLIVGDGPERAALEKVAARRGLAGAVEFTGAVDPAEVPAQLARMDVAVAPYPDLPDFYFSPLKMYEYMAAGCAIVASAIGQITDVLEDGRAALLYRPGDAVGMAKAIERLRDDPSLRRRLASAARQQVLNHHTWDQVAGRILTLIQTMRSPNETREAVVQ